MFLKTELWVYVKARKIAQSKEKKCLYPIGGGGNKNKNKKPGACLAQKRGARDGTQTHVGMSKRLDIGPAQQRIGKHEPSSRACNSSRAHESYNLYTPDTRQYARPQGQAMELIQDVIQKWPAVPVGKSHKRADGQTPPPSPGGGGEIIKDREK
jgi:hypothetical protein